MDGTGGGLSGRRRRADEEVEKWRGDGQLGWRRDMGRGRGEQAWRGGGPGNETKVGHEGEGSEREEID